MPSKGFAIEAAILDAFQRQPRCKRRASTLPSYDFADEAKDNRADV
jgi:hypothetical protein